MPITAIPSVYLGRHIILYQVLVTVKKRKISVRQPLTMRQ